MDSRSSSVVSTAISSYSALSFTSNFATNHNSNNHYSNNARVNQLLSKYTQSNRHAHIHGGDLVIFSVPPPASDDDKENGERRQPSSSTSPIKGPPDSGFRINNNNSKNEDVDDNSMNINTQQNQNTNDNVVAEKNSSKKNVRELNYSGIFSGPTYSFGELRPLFAMTRLRLLYEFHLRNVISSGNKRSENFQSYYDDDGDDPQGNLKIDLNPVMTKILYATAHSDAPSSSPLSITNNNNLSFLTNNPSLLVYSSEFVNQNINTLEQQLKDAVGSSTTKSGAGRVANYARTVKKKNILFDFEEDVLESATILRMRKIRNVAEWFMKVNFLKNLLNKQRGFLLEKKLSDELGSNTNRMQRQQQETKQPKIFTSSNNSALIAQKRREVCGHIVTFPALTLILTRVASQSNNSGFSSRPLSGLALLALVCAEHGELEIAAAATRILPFGGVLSQVLPDNYFGDNGNSKLREKHGNESCVTDVAERTECFVLGASRERELHREFDAVLKLAMQSGSSNNNNNNNSANQTKLNKAVLLSSPASSKSGTTKASSSSPTLNFGEAVKMVKSPTKSGDEKCENSDASRPPNISTLQDAINFLVDEQDSKMSNREKQLVLKNAGDDGLAFEERERRRLAVKFAQQSQQQPNSSTHTHFNAAKPRNNAQTVGENASRLLEKFGKSVSEANFIHNRIGFRDPINLERSKIEKFLLRNFPLQSPSSYKKEIALFTSEIVEKLYSSPKITSSLQERYLCLCDMFCVNPNRHLLFSSSFSQCSTPEDLVEISFRGNYIGDRGLLPILELCRYRHDLVEGKCCFDNADEDRQIKPESTLPEKEENSNNNNNENLLKDAKLSQTAGSFSGIDECAASSQSKEKRPKKVALTREEKLDLRHVAGNRLLLENHCTLTPNFNFLDLPNAGISDVGCEFIAEWLTQKFLHSSGDPNATIRCKNVSTVKNPLNTLKIDLSGNKDIGMGGSMCFIRTLEKIRRLCGGSTEWWVAAAMNQASSLEKIKLEPTAFQKEQREKNRKIEKNNNNENFSSERDAESSSREKGMELLEDGAFFTLAAARIKSAKITTIKTTAKHDKEEIIDSSLADEMQNDADNDRDERYCFVFVDLRNCSVPAGLCRRIVQLGLI